MPEALNAVIYARYSSDRQTEQSIEGQLRECYAFAKANDIAVIDTYIDRAISGKTDNRPAFQKMIEDSAKCQFQAVIVYRLDRFTRNRYDSAIYKARLKKNGVKVLSAMENLNGSPESIIMESLLEGMAEYYSVELSQKITRGMRENALKGKALGGQRILGYKVNSDCYFEIDETTAPVVVYIFKLYSSGKTVKEICDILNARGVKTARGGAFNKNSLHTILTNKKYIGIYKTKYGEIVGGIPAIIDKELFEMVALRMEQNKKAPARAKAEINYLLSTKLFCGKCRSAMVGESGTSKTGKKYYYYACVKKKREKACDKSNVKKDWIEDLVIQRTVTDILKDDVIEKIADRLVELQKAEAAQSGTMLYLENSLAEIQVSIKNIMTAIEKGIITESTKTRLTELEDEKRNVEIEIAKESIARRIISREQIIYWISSFKGGDITSEKYRQQLIDTFVHAVFVYDDKIVITYNYSGENNTATISDLDLSSPPKIRPSAKGRWSYFWALLYSMACRKSSQALSTALPMCCMVRPTQVFMDLCRGETAMPTAAPSTMPAPIPHQNAVFSISLTLLFAQRQYAPCAAKKSESALLKSAIAVIIFLKSDKKRGSLMTTIYLIRHAEADGNLYRRAHGWYDSVITDRGYRQIAALAKRFASTHFDAVYSSDRRRTMTTALSVYKTHGLPLVTTPRVREIGIGVWEDHPWAELERTDGEQLERFNTDAAHWHVAGGEYLPDVRERMIGALREIAEAHPNGTVAVFSHGMAIRLTVGTLQGLSLHEIDGTGHAENTAVSRLEYENGAFRVVYRDDASHLSDELMSLKRQAWLKNARGFEGGIYYVPSGAEGHFDVCRAGETVGAVSVDKCENGLATIGEFWLENDVQGLGFGQQLVGQALSYARAHGCERLSTGRIAKGNALGLRCAQEWGFTQTGEGADWLEFQKNFEYDEESCWKKLQEVIEKEK